MVDFRGENAVQRHAHSRRPIRRPSSCAKGKGQEAKLSYGGHALMENRHGLCVDIEVTSAVDSEPKPREDDARSTAAPAVSPGRSGRTRATTAVISSRILRSRKIAPHIAMINERKTPGLDRRTTRHESYRVSQRKRKRIEEIFGWMKTYGGLRRTKMRGLRRVQLHAYLVGAAYNLLRLARLRPMTG